MASYTQNDHDEITAAIVALGKGQRVARVTFSNGKSVEYGPASLQELKNLRSEIAGELATVAGTSDDYAIISTSKGYRVRPGNRAGPGRVF